MKISYIKTTIKSFIFQKKKTIKSFKYLNTFIENLGSKQEELKLFELIETMGPNYNYKIITGANNKFGYLQNRSLETIPFSESPSPVATVGLKLWALKL